MPNDRELLDEFSRSKSEEAFRALAKGHLAALSIIAISLPIIAIQSSEHSRLEREISKLHTTAATLEGRQSASSPSNRTRPTGQRRKLSLEQILAISDPQKRLDELLDFASCVAPTHIPGTIADIRAITPDWDQDAHLTTQLLYIRWGKTDIEGALEWALEQESPSRSGAMSGILRTLQSTNSDQASASFKRWQLTNPSEAGQWANGSID